MVSLDTDTDMESFACGGRAGVWGDRGVHQCFSALAKDKRRLRFVANLGGGECKGFSRRRRQCRLVPCSEKNNGHGRSFLSMEFTTRPGVEPGHDGSPRVSQFWPDKPESWP